jgi:hypothetical protein
MDIRTAILTYQYSERITSELNIAFKMLSSYLESALGKIRMVQSQKKSSYLREAERKGKKRR